MTPAQQQYSGIDKHPGITHGFSVVMHAAHSQPLALPMTGANLFLLVAAGAVFIVAGLIFRLGR